jgi:2-polyprenyl-3-methyl-5-hydroxy-6-metoxy-1,4-benzoquinol methylase
MRNLTLATGPCIVCGSAKIHYNFSLGDFRVEQCSACKLMQLVPQPSDAQLAEVYGARYFIMSDEAGEHNHVTQLKSNTARDYLKRIESYTGRPLAGDLLEIGCGHGEFLLEAAERSLVVTGIEYSAHSAAVAAQRLGNRGEIIVGDISRLETSDKRFDFIVFADVLEHVRDPRLFLQNVHALLKPAGVAIAILPSLDSLSARLMGSSWREFKLENLWYFSTPNLKRLFHGERFGALRVLPARKTLSLDHIFGHFQRYPVQPISSFLTFLGRLLPRVVRRFPVKVTAGGIMLLSTRIENRTKKKLSVIMPAYNEAQTIAAGIERVLAKEVDGVSIELIIIESNSTDGTRDIVRNFERHDRVKLVLQDRAMGKGNAVRAGFAAMTGDYVIIQDADDEYDIEDYEALLEPLITGEVDFVLGARHGGGGWKMRRFTGQPVLSHIMNLGHWFFATLINVTYGLRLKDPFTMYKVFRADCLRNLVFECNRFDFDCELVIKLVRKGYIPIEIPVNYRSRSFDQGKKVDVLRDPLTWFWAILKYRFQSI